MIEQLELGAYTWKETLIVIFAIEIEIAKDDSGRQWTIYHALEWPDLSFTRYVHSTDEGILRYFVKADLSKDERKDLIKTTQQWLARRQAKTSQIIEFLKFFESQDPVTDQTPIIK